MKVSEITNDFLIRISKGIGLPLSDSVVMFMAEELLDRRGEGKVEAVVKYYRHGDLHDLVKTVNGAIVETYGDFLPSAIGKPLMCRTCLDNEITAAEYEAAKPASEGKSEWFCSTCNKAVPGNEVTFQETHDERYGGCGCTVTSRFATNPTPPAKPDALDREIATEEYMNDEGKAEPVEPLPFLNDRTDDLPIVIRRMNLFLNVVNELQRKHDALEAEVKALREKMEGGK